MEHSSATTSTRPSRPILSHLYLRRNALRTKAMALHPCALSLSSVQVLPFLPTRTTTFAIKTCANLTPCAELRMGPTSLPGAEDPSF